MAADVHHGIVDGLSLIVHGDHTVFALAGQSLRIAGESTAIASLIAVPLGCLLGLGRFPGRRVALGAVNALVRFPPVAIGLIALLLLYPSSSWGPGPLAGLGWLFTLSGVMLGQTLIAIPIVASLTASAVQGAPGPLLVQARAYGAGPLALARLALREGWAQVIAAVIAAVGVTIGTVGAIVIMAGPYGQTSLAPAILVEWAKGVDNPRAAAYGTVLLGLFLVIAASLTVVQQRGAGGGRRRVRVDEQMTAAGIGRAA